ncbi:hypothetical protein [Legionella spiritensis]|uniref:Uncharacterized protein n=1 Tax=Legionella spiritensis TaxID=452 RepID=A0A0W0Z990_LEGSP|nr:hypothetical protein [Legionella spiritensis]KTD65669.1 hypothetical protein Lspi_0381 [Legionella spiritensis]SNV43629.1 Uncharacterised protein [Legionella spiritensis]
MHHMIHITLFYIFIFLSLITAMAHAADIPTQVIGAEEYDKEMCVQQYTDTCINAICLTSTATDCQEQCRSKAKDKCAEQMEE